jgi:hypothetical protein
MRIKEAKLAFHREALKSQLINKSKYPLTLNTAEFNEIITRTEVVPEIRTGC